MDETETVIGRMTGWAVVPVAEGETLAMSVLLAPWRALPDDPSFRGASPDTHMHPVAGKYEPHAHAAGAQPHRHKRPVPREQNIFDALHGANLSEGL